MKKLVVLLLAVALGCTEKKPVEEGFVVKGKFSKIDAPVLVKLNYTDDKNNQVFDECISKNGEFVFKGKTTASGAKIFFVPYSPKYDKTQKEYWEFAMKEAASKKYFNKIRSFFLEDGSFEFTGADDLMVADLETESKNQQLYQEYEKEFTALGEKYFSLSEKKHLDSLKGDKAQTALMEDAILQQQRKITDYGYEFAKKHPDSKVSLAALKGDGVNIDTDKLEVSIKGLSKELQATPVSAAFKKLVSISNKNKLGNAAINFSLDDPKGNKKSLSSYKGKFILVDFWASWCAPCRAENPNVLKAYQTFKGENFDIISISVDSNKEAWLKAVEEDKLPWLNLIDGQTAKSSTAMAYGVLAVPTNFLIDPSGKIVAKNLIGEALHRKLAAVLKK